MDHAENETQQEYATDKQSPPPKVGDKYNNTQITGLDLTASQAQFCPPNVNFIVDDIENEWTFDDDFDLMFMSFVLAWVKDPHKVIDNAFR